YVLFNFKLFLKDKYSFKIAFIVIDRLRKRVISILYIKKVTIALVVKLYFKYVFRIYSILEIIILDKSS
ncbi:hypothetical protein M501DRAFT_943525, partial [Patellaria atrata CBS 101060]